MQVQTVTVTVNAAGTLTNELEWSSRAGHADKGLALNAC